MSLYKIGIEFTGRSAKEALELHREVAKQGWAPAQYKLGCCYNEGKGVERDPKEAVKWFSKAAEQGHPEAQSQLGVCYDVGDGVKENKTEAVKWYRKAAAQNVDNPNSILVVVMRMEKVSSEMS